MSDETIFFAPIEGVTGKEVYVLHGVADRDPNERVCMFFASVKDRAKFAEDLPGSYDRLTLTGVGYDDFKVVAW